MRTQHYEASVNPLVSAVTPGLAFHLDVEGRNVLGFHFLDGYRHPDLSPGSKDLARVAAALRILALVRLPAGLDVRHAEQRYASYAGGDGTASHDDVSLFVAALKNLWEEISAASPEGWRADVAAAAREWAAFRELS